MPSILNFLHCTFSTILTHTYSHFAQDDFIDDEEEEEEQEVVHKKKSKKKLKKKKKRNEEASELDDSDFELIAE